jgi:hypothetical protein
MNKSPRPGTEEWRQIIGGQASSGLTVAAYCLERGIIQGSFYTWKRRLRQPAKRKRTSKPAFVEVSPPRVETAGTFEICLRGGRHLLAQRGFDRELLIELVRALESIS